MSSRFTSEITQILVGSGAAHADELKGSTEEEIQSLADALGVAFPAAYEAFLHVAGNGAGSFLAGTDFTTPILVDLREPAEALLAESGRELPPEAFVFAMHQGYMFWYFRTQQGQDDPAVCRFTEGQPGPEEAAPGFVEFLRRCAQGQAELGIDAP
jgi:hypothetical protein